MQYQTKGSPNGTALLYIYYNTFKNYNTGIKS